MFMRFITKGRHGRALAAVAGLAISATMLITVPATAEASAAGTSEASGAAAHFPHATRPAATRATAKAHAAAKARAQAAMLGRARAVATARARKSGKKVPVSALTTDDSSTVANPNGSFTTTSTAEPTRMKTASGAWETLSTTLRRNPRGTLSPAAEPGHLTFSGGGSGPLVTLTGPAGQSLALTLPVTLPRPVMSGPSATYRDIYPGVSLTVTAKATGGFSEVFTVQNAAAAARVRTLTLHTTLTGLHLTEDRWGNLRATDARTGKTIITAPPPAMWDSATTAGPAKRGHGTHRGGGVDATTVTGKTSSAAGPGLRAHTGPLTVSLGQGTLTLHTNTTALDGTPDFPVYYDPTWSLPFFSGGTQASTQVQSGTDPPNGCANYTYFNSVSQIGVGYNEFESCVGAMRAYYQVDTSGIIDPSYIVTSSTLQATEVFSADNSCGDGSQVVSLYLSAPIGPGTDWNNQPVQGGALDSQSVETVGNADGTMCSGGIVSADFNAMPLINDARNGGWPNVTFALVGNESQSTSLERFSNDPAINTTYDIPPDTPTGLAASPAPVTAAGTVWQGCDGDIDGYLPANDVDGQNIATLSATLTSAVASAEMDGKFEFYDHTTGKEWFMTSSGYVTSGGTVSVETPPLTDGHLYTWQVSSSDQFYSSPTAHYCGFIVDGTPPLKPTVTSDSFPPLGSGTTGITAGTPGTLKVTSSDPASASGTASGLKGFYYSMDQPVPTDGAAFVAAAGDGSASISFTPPANGWGMHTLYVEASDNAGNRSAPAQYSFYVPWNPAAKVTPGDINGDGIPDLLITDSAGDLVEYPGNSDPAAAPVTLSTPATSPDFTSWSNYLITHRGSMTNQSVDDLWAYSTTTDNLYLYENNGSATGGNFEATGDATNIGKGDVLNDEHYDSSAGDRSATSSCYVTSTGSCAGYDNTDWKNVTQILAPGDLYRGDPVAGIDSGTPGLLTVENGSLWYYQGQNYNDYLGTAIQLGSSGWNTVTLLGPGTVGGKTVLWARDNATGVIYQYPITFDAAGYPVDLGTPTGGSGSPLSLPAAATLAAAQDPVIVSPGDLHDTGNPDLVAGTGNGRLLDYPGTAPTSAGLATFANPVPLVSPGGPPPQAGPATAAALSGGAVALYQVASDGNVWDASQGTPGGPFSPWAQLSTGGAFTGSPTAVQAPSGQIDIFARTTTGQVQGATQPTAGAPATSFTVTGTGNPGLAADPAVIDLASGELAMYGTGTDGNIWGTDQTSNGSWTPWIQISTGGGFTGRPAATQAANGEISIYARTTGGQIEGASQTSAGGPFSPFITIGTGNPGLAGDPQIVPLANGELAIYGVGTGGNIWGTNQTSQYGSWAPWMKISTGGGFTGRPAATQAANGEISIYAHTTGGQIEGASQTSAGGPFSPFIVIGGTATVLTGDPDLLRAQNGALAIYASGSGNTIWGTNEKNNGPWANWVEEVAI
jgi:hypothetical protein